jgi:hypothetical protein
MAVLAIRHDAAVCELDGPRITGPITSLKMPGSLSIFQFFEVYVFISQKG